MSGGRLGVQISSMTEELRRYFGAPGDQGVLVGHVDPDSAAAKAGLAVGDVIVEIDGQKVDEPGDLVGALATRGAGTRIPLGVIRDKKRQTLTATLTDAPHAQAFGNVDMDFDFHDLPALPGMRGFSFGGDELLKLRQQLEALERRLEKLEKRGATH
jgi:membrane-associated protease RseP (regulator of RpoE activity)